MVTQTPDGKMRFEFYRPKARQVAIAGDFNGWATSFQMTRGRDGWWRGQIELAPGLYRFRYCADDQWYTDYAAFGVEPGPLGWNSVLKVEPPPQEDVLAAAVRQHLEPTTPCVAAPAEPARPPKPTKSTRPPGPARASGPVRLPPPGSKALRDGPSRLRRTPEESGISLLS